MAEFETKDSGAREEYDSGMKRDTEAGKPRFDLMIPEGVPYEEQLLTRFAKLLSRGAEKYDARNWEKATGEAEIARARSSAFRHFMQWFCGERDEDHAVATIFNIMVVETTSGKIADPVEEERDEARIGFFESGGDAYVDWRSPKVLNVEELQGYVNEMFKNVSLDFPIHFKDTVRPPVPDFTVDMEGVVTTSRELDYKIYTADIDPVDDIL